ncbi:MAG: SpoIIE family protein phosphatase [Oscillatoriophycideae cyanobacterium NC_groundwater_1537_Pr4_S-0.65um_50_18]|nr:SpoIIE family protein phosphatase [Oscillatoriophycideae cyanobacterium NC_groundwater_1537_Pr4_S-0.65um_50_18]
MSKILVIDDDSVIRVIMKRALQNQGHEVVVVANGKEGIEQAQKMQPALIICDWMMPFVDGLEVCRWVKANPDLATTFFILLTSRGGIADRVKGLNTGADDFLSKPIDITELQARVRSALRLHHLSQDLRTQKHLLEAELAEAASYVQALLPPPLVGAVSIEARFIPSRQLGGDCFDYFWLDPDHLAVYLLDVSGHGLGAALPSVSVMNLLRSRALPEVDFCQPEAVLKALNDQFQMSSQNEKYFTIWYGVYNPKSCQLTYSSAGHPAAVLITLNPEGKPQLTQLKTPCLPIGLMEESTYISDRQAIPENSALYIFSDGVYELDPVQAQAWDLKAFIQMLQNLEVNASLDIALSKIQNLSGVETFNDDFSLLKVQFNSSAL